MRHRSPTRQTKRTPIFFDEDFAKVIWNGYFNQNKHFQKRRNLKSATRQNVY